MSKGKNLHNPEEKTRIAAGAALEIKAPKHCKIDRRHKPFFDSIVEEYPKADWTKHELEMAAVLARIMFNLHGELVALELEGSTLTTPEGKKYASPRITIISTHESAVLGLRRSLMLNTRLKSGEVTNNKKHAESRKKRVELQNMAELMQHNVLIPTPRRPAN
jgi:hypothetical protein